MKFTESDGAALIFFSTKLEELSDDVLQKKERMPRASKEADDDIEEDSDDALFNSELSDVPSVLSEVESAAQDLLEENLCEDDVSSGAKEPGQAGADEEVEEEVVHDRAPPGSYVVDRNGYFTFLNDSAYEYVRVRMLPRWRCAEEMGCKNASKAVTCAHFGENKLEPIVRSFLVLRAWMISRFQLEGFHERKRTRQIWLAQQIVELRNSIADLDAPGGGTGCAAADAKIKQWAPMCLP